MLNRDEQGKKLSQLIARCWADEGFKQSLLTDPAATLKADGVEIPAGMSIKALENTAQVFHLVIPAKPTELSDEELEEVSAGIMCTKIRNSGDFLIVDPLTINKIITP